MGLPGRIFKKRIHYINRQSIDADSVRRAAELIENKKKPFVICGGGVRYSEAGDTLASFCEEFNIPFGETQAGKSAVVWDHPMNLGGIGVTGGLAANKISADADLIIAVGTRLSDFTTSSKWAFKNPDVEIISLNVNKFDGYKMDAHPFQCDAKAGLEAIGAELKREDTNHPVEKI